MIKGRVFSRAVLLLVLGVGLLSLGGCASTGGYVDPRDPYEPVNRKIYSFNESLDRAVIKPVAEGYRAVTPEIVDRGVTNFFSNIGDVRSAVNNLLQFKLERALTSTARVVVNSSFGLLGVFDVATSWDLLRAEEDFGQTLGYWGIGSGPYLVLPILGPSSVRDGIGLVGDWHLNLVNHLDDEAWRYGLTGLNIIDTRADLLGASNVLDTAALDPYEFVRDAYLQKRENEVYDGAPPLEDDLEEFLEQR